MKGAKTLGAESRGQSWTRSTSERRTLDQVVATFGHHRILTFDREPLTREPTVEIAHEALIAGWGRLRDWIDAAREDLRTERRLSRAATEWRAADKDPSYLLQWGTTGAGRGMGRHDRSRHSAATSCRT